MKKEKIFKSFYAGIFSFYYHFNLPFNLQNYSRIFLIASFGSSMVLLYGYPESPFAQPKIFFGHLVTALVGIILSNFLTIPIYILLPIAVGLGVGLMIFLDVTHPPAGGNPIIVIIGGVSFDYLISPVILGSIIILIFGVILNRFILRKKLPGKMDIKYNITKFKNSTSEEVKDPISVEEPLQMNLNLN